MIDNAEKLFDEITKLFTSTSIQSQKNKDSKVSKKKEDIAELEARLNGLKIRKDLFGMYMLLFALANPSKTKNKEHCDLFISDDTKIKLWSSLLTALEVSEEQQKLDDLAIIIKIKIQVVKIICQPETFTELLEKLAKLIHSLTATLESSLEVSSAKTSKKTSSFWRTSLTNSSNRKSVERSSLLAIGEVSSEKTDLDTRINSNLNRLVEDCKKLATEEDKFLGRFITNKHIVDVQNYYHCCKAILDILIKIDNLPETSNAWDLVGIPLQDFLLEALNLTAQDSIKNKITLDQLEQYLSYLFKEAIEPIFTEAPKNKHS